jgi:chaperonin GroES
MTPIRNLVLVKPFPSDELSEGGIFVPESARRVSNKVRVVKVGNGTLKRPMKLKEGDVGFRVENWGTEVLIGGELHFLLDEGAIIAKEN